MKLNTIHQGDWIERVMLRALMRIVEDSMPTRTLEEKQSAIMSHFHS